MAKGKKKEIKKKDSSDKKPKKKTVAKAKPKLKQDLVPSDGAGIIVVEDDTILDKEAELEARKAYLEEARSQEASED